MHTILFLHILGAVVSGVVILGILMNIARARNNRTASRIVQWLAVFEVLSGMILAVNGPAEAAPACKNIFIYTAIVTATITFARAKDKQQRLILNTIAPNTILAITAVSIILVTK